MAMPRFLPAALGVTALLATVAVLVLNIANAQTARRSSVNVQIAAGIAAALEAAILMLLTVLLYKVVRKSTEQNSRRSSGIWFGISLFGSVLATTASVVVLVILGDETENVDIFGGPEVQFLIGSAIVLGLAFAGQLVFTVAYFVVSRVPQHGHAHSLHTDDESGRSPHMRVKTIPYTQTVVASTSTKERPSTDFQSPPGSSSGRSAAETMSSIRTSLSNVVRPISSKTRLLSNSTRTSRSGRRPPSLDSISQREHSGTSDDGFDSWDTSAVDPQNRQTVLETSSPTPPRFLETIPASPTTSRSPSPGCPLDLEPPKKLRHRSRSYSPIPKPPPVLTTHASTSELHIHPLFRSDSPTPPPAATPGTMVVAAPNGGKIISERTLTRMRSGSLPAASSPLSQKGSYESFQRKSPSPTAERLSPLSPDPVEERKMTPPIPDWILSAGSRSSLTEYHTRKLRSREELQDSGLGIAL